MLCYVRLGYIKLSKVKPPAGVRSLVLVRLGYIRVKPTQGLGAWGGVG